LNELRRQRLISDEERLRALAALNPDRLIIQTTKGNPPDSYEIVLQCKTVTALRGGAPVYGSRHVLRVTLPPSYPLQARPHAAYLTPVRNPHVFPSRDVCIGSKGSLTEFLDAFVRRMYDVLRYDPEYIDPDSPADRDAMAWAQQNMHLLPLDATPLCVPGLGEEPPTILWRNRP